MQSGIKYRYAKNSHGTVVDIDAVPRISRGKDNFTCLACNNSLSAIQGEQRTWHFRHKAENTECTNSGETYLHELAKLVFYETYQECLQTQQPFLIKYRQPVLGCDDRMGDAPCTAEYFREYDLTQKFDTIKKEQHHKGYIPDLLLLGDDEALFVEICVHHGCDHEKINSGFGIIEFVVNKDTNHELLSARRHREVSKADDQQFEQNQTSIVDLIKSRCLEVAASTSLDHPKIKLYNFNYGAPGTSDCSKSCRKPMAKDSRPNVVESNKPTDFRTGTWSGSTHTLSEVATSYFVLGDDGKCAIKYLLSRQAEDIQRQGVYAVPINGRLKPEELAQKIEAAYLTGRVVTDCWLCDQHIHDEASGRSYCLKIKERLFPDFAALRCQFYPKHQMVKSECSNLLGKKISAFNTAIKSITIDQITHKIS